MNQIDQALGEFSNDDYTVRICHAVLGSLPFAPPMHAYTSLSGAKDALYPMATPAQVARMNELAGGDGVKSALWVASAIDTGDSGIAVYSGLKSALGFFFGSGSRTDALESDPQQATDAGLKLLGLATMIYRLFPGSVSEKVELFQIAPAGKTLAIYLGAVEVALPFADNLTQEGGDFLQRLMGRYGSDAASKLGSVIGQGAIGEAQGVMGSLMGPVQGVVTQVGPYARTIADSAKQYVPGFMNAVDKVAGVVATGADALPVYKFLGARLAAEACVLVASKNL